MHKLISVNVLASALAIGAVFGSGIAQAAIDPTLPSDAEIRELLADRIDHQRQSIGIAVGIIEPSGRRVISYGTLDKGDTHQVNGDTIFEIGAITKVFTGLLLADMVHRHEVALSDPIGKYLPKTLKLQPNVEQITLEGLATHTSGLPRTPPNLVPQDPANPYAVYTTKQLYEFLSGYRQQRTDKAEAEYSQLGYALLGQVLASRSGMSYEALVHSRIAVPLGLKSTGITLSREMETRFAAGHDSLLNPARAWDFAAFAGAGALRSTANDLLTFLAAQMDYTHTALAPAMAMSVRVRRPTSIDYIQNALGWQVANLGGNEIIQKDGSSLSGGYSTFIAYNPAARVGVIVLSNTLWFGGISDLGLHLIDQRIPLRGRTQKEIKVDPKVLEGYVGRYEFSSKVDLTITYEGGYLYAQLTGQPKMPIFPESERNYFYKKYDAQISFEPDSDHRAAALVLYYNSRISRAKRVETQASSPK